MNIEYSATPLSEQLRTPLVKCESHVNHRLT